jgi:hypothetical protein
MLNNLHSLADSLDNSGADVGSVTQQAQIISVIFANNETTYENDIMENVMDLTSHYLSNGFDSNTTGDKARELSVPLLGTFCLLKSM